MKKRVLSLLVALCLTLVLIPTVSADNVRPTTSTPQSSEIDTLSPNEALTVTIEPGNSVTFDFDFDTHGYYIFTSTAFDYYGIMSHPTLTISVKDADLCRSAEGELVFHSDEAAEFCYLSAENWSDSTISVTLLITQINAEQIQINSTITSDIVCGEYVEYLFTPEKSGVYTFYFAGKPKTGPHTLLNADIRINDNASFLSKTAVRYDSENPSNHFTLLQAELEAGDVYRYRLTNSPGFHEDDAYQTYVTTVEVSIAETVPIQSISMGTAFDDLWGFFYDNGHVYAYTGYGANLQAYIHPIHAQIEDIFWSSTNTAVATSDSSDSLVHISCIAPGNSIITATTASGLSASCEVNVYDQVTYNVVSDNDLVWTHIAGNDLHYDISPCANKVYKIKVYDENGVYYSTTADDYTINFHHTDEISRVTFHNDFLQKLPESNYSAVVYFTDGIAVTSFSITQNEHTVPPFTDVPAGSFYEDAVLWAVEENITKGLTPTTFGPTKVCNRATVVTFLWRAAGSPAPKTTTHNFVDVVPGSFYEKAVLWAVENKITSGTDATHFNPNGICNRATVVTFLYRAFGSPPVENANNPFTDVPAGKWYTNAILWAVEQNITKGLNGTTFGPTNSCNRATVVTFLYRAYND